jgi:hypothetical protein
MTALALREIATALGGEVSGDSVLAPGPGHSATDRSLSITLSATAPDGFVVHSFAGDDDMDCRDYVRTRLGLERFKPNSRPNGGQDKSNGAKAKLLRTIIYDYCDPASGGSRYRKTRREYAGGTKAFLIDPKGRGGSAPLLYGGERLADLRENQSVWIAEGEKKVERLRELGAVAVSGDTGANSKWLPEHAQLLRGLSVIFWPDSDDPGERYIANAAAAILADNPDADLRVVRPFPMAAKGEKGKDVCDWAGESAALAAVERDAAPWEARDKQDALATTALTPIVLLGFNPSDWETDPEPEQRKWVVPNYIPDETVTLLYADGGTGKSYLKLQIATARALGRDWVGLLPEPGRTLVLSCEDDLKEMKRRLYGILKFYLPDIKDPGARWKALGGEIRLVDLVGGNSVLGLLKRGIIVPTEMYHALDRYLAEFKPGLAALDVLADLFGGSEIERTQVRQFMNLLHALCRKHQCAILLLAHPSRSGMNTGTGTSGSTDWHNSVRARIYLETPAGLENNGQRIFKGMKNNRGELGGPIEIEWKDGLFRRINGPTGFDKLAAEQRVNEVFLMLLKRFTTQHIPVRATESRSGAPTLFAAEPDNQGFKSEDFKAAMRRLLNNGKILNELESEGPPSRRLPRLVIP